MLAKRNPEMQMKHTVERLGRDIAGGRVAEAEHNPPETRQGNGNEIGVIDAKGVEAVIANEILNDPLVYTERINTGSPLAGSIRMLVAEKQTRTNGGTRKTDT